MKNPELPKPESGDKKKFTTFSLPDHQGLKVVVSDNEDTHVYRDEVACNAGGVIYIHLAAYRILQRSPEFERYLNVILEHEATHGPGHTHEELEQSKDEQEVLDFLKKEGFFE